MKKKTFNILTFLITLIYLIGTTLFMFFLGNKVKIIGMTYINIVYLILVITCLIINYIIFKKANFLEKDSPKDFRKKMSESTANSFILSTIVSSIIVLLLFQFLENILEYLKLEIGIINYIVYALKIFFVSIPFLGLEITIYKYFYQIECYGKIVKTLFFKVLILFVLSFLLFPKYNTSSIFYSKIFTDLIFLYYFTKTCFEITIRKR